MIPRLLPILRIVVFIRLNVTFRYKLPALIRSYNIIAKDDNVLRFEISNTEHPQEEIRQVVETLFRK